jgi:hypothetical protein
MENIQKHIDYDRGIVENPMASSQSRRHAEEELEQLEKYHAKHPDDNHDPTPFELFCDEHPDALECRIYDD